MRYSVISKGLPVGHLQSLVMKCGGRNVRAATKVGQVMCDLDDAGAAKLSQEQGLVIKKIGGKTRAVSLIKPQTSVPIEPFQEISPQQPVYAMSQVQTSLAWYQLREMTSPPSTGQEMTIVVMDSGIRKTHRGLVDKVVYEQNFTTSPTVSDIFSHGTGVAFMAAGGQHAPGQEAGIAPGASLMNFKVLGDNGEGTVEDLIMALDAVTKMRADAVDRGLSLADPLMPNVINLSVGAEDDGDPDNPLRVAAKAIIDLPHPYGLNIYAAAGNSGPNPGTLLLPASMPEVIALGVVTFSPFSIWYYSSRGPALDGTIKPDFCTFGVDVVTADSADDEAFATKSGTSFAAPVGAAGGLGLMALLWKLGYLPSLDAAWEHKPFEEWVPLVQFMCVKPSDAPDPVAKDNVYGYGVPYGGVLLQYVQSGGLGSIMESMMPMMMLPIMMNMIA